MKEGWRGEKALAAIDAGSLEPDLNPVHRLRVIVVCVDRTLDRVFQCTAVDQPSACNYQVSIGFSNDCLSNARRLAADEPLQGGAAGVRGEDASAAHEAIMIRAVALRVLGTGGEGEP